MKFSLNLNSDKLNLIIGSLILPSLLLPVRYSSLILIIVSLASIYNVIYKRKKILSNYLFFPFLIYFISIIIAYIIDLFNHQRDSTFLLRNLSVFIIPLFIFTSNFSKKQILNILKTTSIIITIVGVFFLILWVFGYYRYNNQQEFQKKEWFKNEIITPKDYLTKKSDFDVIIKPLSKKPSLRKVIMLTEKQSEKTIVREFIVKAKNTNKDIWVLLRNVNDGNCKVWFNATNGKVGNIEGESKTKSEKTSDGFYKFTLANKPKSNSTREWFYISFVSENGSYSWNTISNENTYIQLKEPNAYLDTGENLLAKKTLFNYKITNFSNLENYAHSTYLGLIFTFSLIMFVFNPFVKNFMRFTLIVFHIFIIVTLASKAVIVSLIFLILIYYLYNYFNYKYLIVAVLLGLFFSFNSHIKERFNDMFKTITTIQEDKNLGDLETLSTNNRIIIYKNYINLIKTNFFIGHGYKNGEEIVNSKYNHNFNTHNQYLQSLFHSGIAGLLFLILFSLSPFLLIKRKNKKKYGLELVIILILFHFLFESLLFRQWGLIFVCFSYAIYFQFFKLELKWFR